MRRVLVTGASGFIGRNVISALAAEGHTLRAAVRRPPLPRLPAGVEVVQHVDFTQSVDWQSLVAGTDAVIHLAGIAHTGEGMSDALYDRVNRQAAEHLAVAAAKAGVSKFVFVSSVRAQIGAAADHVLTEQDPAVPTDAYGRAKLAAEESVRAAGLPYTVLRPVLTYGPGVKGNFSLLFRAAALPLPLPVKAFANRRSLLGVDNFVSALRFVLASSATTRQTYLVSDPGNALSVAEMITVLRQAINRSPGVLRVSPRAIGVVLGILRQRNRWQHIAGDLRVDPAKLIAAGWQPVHDTPEGLATMARDEAIRSRP